MLSRTLWLPLLAVASVAFMAPTAAPETADVRPAFAALNLPIRRQGPRGTCSVFTMTGAVEFAASRRLKRTVLLSPEYLNWAANQATGNPTDGQFFSSVEKGFERYGACLEAEMPYAQGFHPEYEPSERARTSARGIQALKLRIHWIKPNDGKAGLSDAEFAELKAVLSRGWPVCGGCGHSTLYVGFADDASQPGGGTFTVRDSGSGREGTRTYADAKAQLCDLLWVE